MKLKTIVCAIAALSIGASGLAFAQNDNGMRADRAAHIERGERPAVDRDQPRPSAREQHTWQRVNDGDRPDRGGYDRGDRYDNRSRHDGRSPPHADSRDRRDHRDDRDGRGYRDHRDGRGAGPDHSFYRGGRLPPQWRSNQYVVDDWRGHRLSAPPRGYHWVQTGGDYVLVAIATGIIASILLNQ